MKLSGPRAKVKWSLMESNGNLMLCSFSPDSRHQSFNLRRSAVGVVSAGAPEAHRDSQGFTLSVTNEEWDGAARTTLQADGARASRDRVTTNGRMVNSTG